MTPERFRADLKLSCDVLENLTGEKVLGFRAPSFSIRQDTLQWFYPVLESLGLLAERDIPYDLVGVLPAHIETALRVAERWPGLRMIFDHLNQPPILRQDKRWEELMKEAAKHDRFYAKISGLGLAARKGQEWGAGDLEPCIEFALHHFGVDRCCCGGDWPVALLAGTYEKTWKAYRTVIAKYLTPGEQEKILYRNATQFYAI